MPIADGLTHVVLAGAPIAKTTDLLVTVNVVAGPPRAIAAGLRNAGLAGATIAKTTDLQGTDNVVVVVHPAAVDQQEPHATGIAVVEHAEENGRDLAQIQAASFLGALPNACLIMRLPELSVIRQVRPSSLLQQQEIPYGRVVVAAANVFCSLHLLVER